MFALHPFSGLVRLCFSSGMTLVTAKFCTEGMVSAATTKIVGIFQWFDTGFATYRNDAKHGHI